MPPIRVLLVDDHELFRAGMRLLLERNDTIEVVAEAVNGRAALQAVSIHAPHVVLMDLMMSGLNGVEATAHVVKKFPKIRVVIISMHAGEEFVLPSLRAGGSVTS